MKAVHEGLCAAFRVCLRRPAVRGGRLAGVSNVTATSRRQGDGIALKAVVVFVVWGR